MIEALHQGLSTIADIVHLPHHPTPGVCLPGDHPLDETCLPQYVWCATMMALHGPPELLLLGLILFPEALILAAGQVNPLIMAWVPSTTMSPPEALEALSSTPAPPGNTLLAPPGAWNHLQGGAGTHRPHVDLIPPPHHATTVRFPTASDYGERDWERKQERPQTGAGLAPLRPSSDALPYRPQRRSSPPRMPLAQDGLQARGRMPIGGRFQGVSPPSDFDFQDALPALPPRGYGEGGLGPLRLTENWEGPPSRPGFRDHERAPPHMVDRFQDSRYGRHAAIRSLPWFQLLT